MKSLRKLWTGPAVILVAFALAFVGVGTAAAAPTSDSAAAKAPRTTQAAPNSALAYSCYPVYDYRGGRWGWFANYDNTWTTETAKYQNNYRVVEVQCLVISLGYSVGPKGADGDFGGDTERGVINVQKQCYPNTPSEWDGRVGPKTWACLRTL